MSNFSILEFDDITDDFGKPILFTVLNYSFEIAQEVADHIPREEIASSGDEHESTIEIELQYPENLELQVWAMQQRSPTGARRNGNLSVYNATDDSILAELRFEDAECMGLRAGGVHEDGKRVLTKTIHITFAAKALAFNGITLYGQLREDRYAGVTPTVAEDDTEGKITQYYLADAQEQPLRRLNIDTTVYLIIESTGLIGKAIDIPLPFTEVDFIYQGNRLQQDILRNYSITQALEKIALTVVDPIEEDAITNIPL